MEEWIEIENFPGYSISNLGRVRNDNTDRILVQSHNQYNVVCIGMMREGIQYHRSVALLVATAFIPKQLPSFDTPINLNGDRTYNSSKNLLWRPRWFAVQYNRQFRDSYPYRIYGVVEDLKTHQQSANSFECAKRYGLLEKDVVLSIMNRTFVWPTYQQFRVIEE